jgi:mono/diheme cytochrome c family protein
MRNVSATIAAVLGVSVTFASGLAMADSIDPQDFHQIERGRYLTTAGDCAACHTMPGSGKDFAGGRTIETPFGNLLSPNITPDAETGIGAWTDDEFVNALTKGTGRNGTRLYPAMPYPYLTKMSRDDALAIRAYLRTVPAVRNEVHSNQLPFPFSMRWTMAVWDALFFTPGAFHPASDKSAEWNRGAYLAEGPAHCGMCHTPKNFLGGDKTSEKLQGYALQGWFAPDITNDGRRGLGGWSADDIAQYLKSGHNRTSAATGLMSEMISLSTSHMSDGDLHAIAVYLKDQPGGKPGNNDKPDAAAMKMGESIYVDECSGCHTPNGKGTPGMFPSINGSPAVQQADPTSLMRVVLRGARSTGTDAAPTAPAMPAFGWLLDDKQVAAVLTYVRNTWGNAASPVTADDVAAARKDFAKRSD